MKQRGHSGCPFSNEITFSFCPGFARILDIRPIGVITQTLLYEIGTGIGGHLTMSPPQCSR